ncbi:THAP domain-containing protein 1-like isoform X2 [Temnothorax nylanderi]|uniref:THAP domain-containing protein 1-like isoform X2 n=1 Tax=Temnothorax nylanderi TaxID=102681 RepID=UPI003A8C7481
MPSCCADGCFSRQVKGKIFHLLPSGKSDSVRRAEWIRRIGRECWTPNRNTRLCEDHFTPDQYEQNRIDGKRKLKCNAVPSIFMRYIDVKSHQLTDSLIGNMGSDTLCMGDGSSSTNNDPFPAESYIIPDAPCSVDFSRTKSPRPIPEHSFDIEKQELLRKIQLLHKKIEQ